MDEFLVRGLVIGLVFTLVAIFARAVWALIRSPSEGARRLKWVIGLAIALPIGAVLVGEIGVGGVVALAAVIAALIWVAKGFKSKA